MKALRLVHTTLLGSLVLAIPAGFALWAVASGAGSFSPSKSVHLSDSEHDANADITTTFSIPGTDYNYAKLVAFTPEEFFPTDATPPAIGAEVGQIVANATLGLLNGACYQSLPVSMDLLWASTDTNDTIPFAGQFLDVNPANGIPDGAEHYPEFLTRIIPGVEPVERHFGKTSVSGMPVSVNIVTLAPGSLGFSLNWGRVSRVVLNDIGDPAKVPTLSPITDFCTPLNTTTETFGMADGAEVRRNPQYGGAYTFRWYVESMRDAEGDGYENPLDTCPFHPNLDGSPKTPASDPDGDGIDSACDPSPATICWPGAPGLFNDCDNDGYTNRGDNCPLVANANQADADADDIGDTCDTLGAGGIGQGPNTPDGVPVVRNLQVDVDISGPEPPAVGGIAELPEVPNSSARDYIPVATLAAVALLALTLGAWYARRRWGR